MNDSTDRVDAIDDFVCRLQALVRYEMPRKRFLGP